MRLILSFIMIISILSTTISIPITTYAEDEKNINNQSDTEETTTYTSDGKQHLCIYGTTNARKDTVFWVCYVANTAGEMVTDPYIVFPGGYTQANINKVWSADWSLLKCHLDPSVEVTHMRQEPVPGLPAPTAGRPGSESLTDAFINNEFDWQTLIGEMCNGNTALIQDIIAHKDQYYLVAEVANVTTHTSATNETVHQLVYTPFVTVHVYRTLPDGVTGFHLNYHTVKVSMGSAAFAQSKGAISINEYINLWRPVYYGSAKVIENESQAAKAKKSMEVALEHITGGMHEYVDPRYPIKVVWEGNYQMYAATTLGWSMDGTWWDKSQAFLWNYYFPMGNYLGKDWHGLPRKVEGKSVLNKNYNWNPDIGKPEYGWGMAAIRMDGGGDDSSTHIDTYDIPNHPDEPDKCEYPTPGIKSGICTIVKHYWEEQEDGTYKFIETCRRDNCCSNVIHITDEKDKTGYKLIGWWGTNGYNASKDNPTPMDPVKDRRITEAQNGDTEATVTLNPNINENTLVAVFVKPANPAETLDLDGDYIIRQSQISQRNSFDNVDSLKVLSSHIFKWTRAAHQMTCTAHGGDGHLVCTRDEHSHHSSCDSDHDGHNDCGKSEHSHDSDCYDPCGGWGFSDSKIRFGVKNLNNTSYPSVLSYCNEMTINIDSDKIQPNLSREVAYDGNSTTTSADAITSNNWHYNFIIFRGKDYLTLAKWRNDRFNTNVESFLGGISNQSTYNFKSQNTPANTRAAASYIDQFTAKFGNGITHYQSSQDMQTVTYPYTPCSNGNRCDSDPKQYNLNNPTGDYNATVAVNVYWANGEEPDLNITTDEIPQNDVNCHLKAGTVSFIPYIMMRYDDRTQDDNFAAVLSQRTSNGVVTATFYDWIDYELDHDFDQAYAINVTSTQWSTHKTAASELAEFFGGTAPNGSYIANGFADQSILPGGAVFTIGIPNNKVRTVTVKTAQAYLPSCGSGYEQVDKTVGASTGISGIATTNTPLLQAHRDLVDSAMAEWQKTEIHEYLSVSPSLTTSATSSYEIVTHGKELFGDIDVSVLKDDSGNTMINHTNSDTKYYFGGDYSQTLLNTCYGESSGGSNTSDASYEKSTSRMYLTFFTNVYGQVCCLKGEDESSTVLPARIDRCKPNGQLGYDIVLVAEPRSSVIVADPSSIVYEVAVMTDVVRSLRQCTASQRGYDSECPWGNKWYNEAFDGITYIYQETEFKVGLWDAALRDTVLDPAVTPYQENKDDFFTRFHAMALNTWKASDNFSENPFKNNAGNTYMLQYDFKDLYGSQIFYIPNVTTQDLN